MKLLNLDNDGIQWLESDKGEIYGIVSANKILDCDGIPYQEITEIVLYDVCDIYEDYERGCQVIYYSFENGESCEVLLFNEHVELIDTTGDPE